jgi:hypothetical protein
VTELAIKGDRALGALRPVPETPAWARFDEDEEEEERPSHRNGLRGGLSVVDSARPPKVTPVRILPDPEPEDVDEPEPDVTHEVAELPVPRPSSEPTAPETIAEPPGWSPDTGVDGPEAEDGSGAPATSSARRPPEGPEVESDAASTSEPTAPAPFGEKTAPAPFGEKTAPAPSGEKNEPTTDASARMGATGRDTSSGEYAGARNSAAENAEDRNPAVSAGTTPASPSVDVDGSDRAAGEANAAGPPRAASGPPGLPEYESWTLPQLRGRFRALSLRQLEQLLDWETSHQDRPPYVTMLSNRIAAVTGR